MLEHLEKGKEAGMYQDCAWLHVAQAASLFRPGCKRDSLVIFGEPQRVRRGFPLYICPEGCLCFKDPREHAKEEAKARRREWLRQTFWTTPLVPK